MLSGKGFYLLCAFEAMHDSISYQAQLQLNTFGKYARPTTVKNRCVESGRRGVTS
ncbi:hypothetical protein SERLA73DRAFT_47712 [Serpula lacrymans var. lacrymans S7.3]|uniref:Uncharacterized protein n=2 Tax=Serpula lacrymans var. lacrymans TaxID=341189 RepID=F8PM56_SERL3|nr:uncharacterized protein SERLADRAFT_346258 [Serpula lacrymans var. lacrymans S7.9]EGO02688.1 hypothetical protein SERLA73DRAFT_47712 [Serpula lacrymans var. lacrymans S7.3]EGO28387.1 hypothetical protein SERLADRAFT_346258 [Serpula lacrymans var. lacrymans S7.9]